MTKAHPAEARITLHRPAIGTNQLPVQWMLEVVSMEVNTLFESIPLAPSNTDVLLNVWR